MTPSDPNNSSLKSPAGSAGIFASNEDLNVIARRLRRHIITMIGRAGSGHPGGSLSSVEIVTALYWKVLRHKPSDPY